MSGNQQRPNIVLVLADSMRARNISCLGYHRPTTPNIDRLAAVGVRFTNAFTAAPFTVASIASILTGVYPSVHKLEHYGQRLSSDLATLPELLGAVGYLTAGFVANPHINRESGLTRGWQTFSDGRPWYKRPRAFSRLVAWAENGRALNRQVRELLAQLDERPFFFLVFYNDSHVPFSVLPRLLLPLVSEKYHTPAFERQVYSDTELMQVLELYDQALRRADQAIGQLHELVCGAGHGDRTLFLISADHGEGLDRRPERAGHGRLYDNGIHVPLVASAPWLPAGQSVEQLVSTIDFAPTICELAGVPQAGQLQGYSFSALLRGDAPEVTRQSVVSEYHDCRCVRSERWKLIQRGPGIGGPASTPVTATELYDVAQDPAEEHNVAEQHPAIVAELAAALQRFAADNERPEHHPSEFEEDAIVVERLRGLGYI
jgi:arylsulfatase A-like enzyme